MGRLISTLGVMPEESETLWLVAETAEALMEALKTALISQLVLIPCLYSLGDGYLTFLAREELAAGVVGGLLVS